MRREADQREKASFGFFMGLDTPVLENVTNRELRMSEVSTYEDRAVTGKRVLLGAQKCNAVAIDPCPKAIETLSERYRLSDPPIVDPPVIVAAWVGGASSKSITEEYISNLMLVELAS